MRLDDYLQKKESVVTSVQAFDGKNSIGSHRKGTLAVTPSRVVFVRKKMVADISLNGVDSIQYRAPSYPTRYLYWCVGCFCLSILLYALSGAGGDLGAISVILSVIFFLSALVIGALGLLYMRSMLILTTSNKSFEFVSNDDSLANIAHALRGYEQNKSW